MDAQLATVMGDHVAYRVETATEDPWNCLFSQVDTNIKLSDLVPGLPAEDLDANDASLALTLEYDTADTLSDFSGSDARVAGGTGVRYLLSRGFRFRGGFDVAWGPEDTVFYITMGQAW